MVRIAFFDTKPYDREYFDKLNTKYEIEYFENKLTAKTAQLAKGCQAACAFVNDTIDEQAVQTLYDCGVRVLAMRCAGFSNVDFKAAFGKINVVRVPAYSPYAVAEDAMALLQTLNRKLHKAYNRTREFNFSLVGLTGMDLHGKTVGVIGTGKIGQVFIDICRGYGMKVIAYDLYPVEGKGITYVDLDTLFRESDVISLHCPLTDKTYHILDKEAFSKMKPGVFIVNTSRGALIDSKELLQALNEEKIRGAGLDVYEEEADLFFEDFSGTMIKDDVLALLVSKPNVILTSHQAFLTEEALLNIAKTSLENLDEFFEGKALSNEICYQCTEGKEKVDCKEEGKSRCF